MTIINTNSISGINSITAQGSSGVAFFDSSGSSERLRIESGGRLLLGTTSLISSSVAANLQVASDFGPRFNIARSDTTTAVDNLIGAFDFYGNDSNGTYQNCARILAEADLDHDTDDKPTRLSFYTTPDGTATPTERLRITSGGDLGLGVSANMSQAGTLHLIGGQGVRWQHPTGGTLYGDHYVSATGKHVFRTGSSLTTQAEIDSTGIKLPSGKGINFSAYATSGNPSSNLLDDYEEGTWTPVIKSGNNTISYTGGTQYFTYIKIGNKVTLSFNLSGATTSGTIGGPFTIQGIPFLAPTNSRNLGSLCNFYGSGLRATHWPAFIHIDHTSDLDIYYKTASNGNYDRDTVAEVGSNTYMMWTATYFVD